MQQNAEQLVRYFALRLSLDAVGRFCSWSGVVGAVPFSPCENAASRGRIFAVLEGW